MKVQCIWQPLSDAEAGAVRELQADCFSDVPQSSIEEDFTAQEFAHVLACSGHEAVGTLGLLKRKVQFEGMRILLGGVSGVCVHHAFRRQGIGTLMLEKGLEVLRQEHCDIACLNVDLEKHLYGVYARLGFRFMNRPISFENARGELVQDTGTMFISICSESVFDHVMNSSATFHYGKGYW